MAILLVDRSPASDAWHKHLPRVLPEFEFRIYPNVGDVHSIDYVCAWAPPEGLLAGLPNLRLIVSLGAGVDHLLADPTLPPDVPIIRLRDPKTAQSMNEYLLGFVLTICQNLPIYIHQQDDMLWQRHLPRLASDFKVGILGLGWLGMSAAKKFVDNGYSVSGWSRSQKDVPGVSCFFGADGLNTLLASSDVTICLLPLTSSTKGFLNKNVFDNCKRGAVLINVARGQHLVDEDLLTSLNEGRLSLAIIDVFKDEPLPSTHPFWKNDRIIITPHISGMGSPEWGAQCVAQYIRDFRDEVEQDGIVNRALGY